MTNKRPWMLVVLALLAVVTVAAPGRRDALEVAQPEVPMVVEQQQPVPEVEPTSLLPLNEATWVQAEVIGSLSKPTSSNEPTAVVKPLSAVVPIVNSATAQTLSVVIPIMNITTVETLSVVASTVQASSPLGFVNWAEWVVQAQQAVSAVSNMQWMESSPILIGQQDLPSVFSPSGGSLVNLAYVGSPSSTSSVPVILYSVISSQSTPMLANLLTWQFQDSAAEWQRVSSIAFQTPSGSGVVQVAYLVAPSWSGQNWGLIQAQEVHNQFQAWAQTASAVSYVVPSNIQTQAYYLPTSVWTSNGVPYVTFLTYDSGSMSGAAVAHSVVAPSWMGQYVSGALKTNTLPQLTFNPSSVTRMFAPSSMSPKNAYEWMSKVITYSSMSVPTQAKVDPLFIYGEAVPNGTAEELAHQDALISKVVARGYNCILVVYYGGADAAAVDRLIAKVHAAGAKVLFAVGAREDSHGDGFGVEELSKVLDVAAIKADFFTPLWRGTSPRHAERFTPFLTAVMNMAIEKNSRLVVFGQSDIIRNRVDSYVPAGSSAIIVVSPVTTRNVMLKFGSGAADKLGAPGARVICGPLFSPMAYVKQDEAKLAAMEAEFIRARFSFFRFNGAGEQDDDSMTRP